MNRTRIKICGLTREIDVDAAVAAGVDAVGFVFYAKSARFVTPARAHDLIRRLPPFVTPVGLFVNASAEEVAETAHFSGIQLLQFHGDELPEACEQASAACAKPFVRAARVAADTTATDLLNFMHRFNSAQAILLDTHVEGFGGGGKVFDWSLIPANADRPLVLSGGLNPANVQSGIARVKPFAVDVSSGVEVAKGIKDATLMRQFVAAVHIADQSSIS